MIFAAVPVIIWVKYFMGLWFRKKNVLVSAEIIW